MERNLPEIEWSWERCCWIQIWKIWGMVVMTMQQMKWPKKPYQVKNFQTSSFSLI